MAIFNLGSVNIDHFYSLHHLPSPGETLAADGYAKRLGGKGANQSVAVAKAGGEIRHIGAVGVDGDWALEALRGLGVATDRIARLDCATGHAIINVDAAGENAIVILGSANRRLEEEQVLAGLDGARPGDFLLLQNETNLTRFAALQARARAMRVVYSAAPFDVGQVAEIWPLIDILALNEGEAAQLDASAVLTDRPETGILVTKGAKGAEYREGGRVVTVDACRVAAVDTTGAGDAYLGYFVAGLDSGKDIGDAMRRAAAAAAIQVTRPGAALAIPDQAEVALFLKTGAKSP